MDLARQDARLNGGADRDDLVGVDALVGLLAEEVLHQLLDARDPGGAADQDHLVDVLGFEAGVLERLAARSHRALDDVLDELFELGPREAHVEVLRPGGVGGDEREVDLALLGRRELALGLLGRLLQALQRHAVLGQVDPLVAAELLDQPLDQALVEVVAAEVGVAVGRLDLDDALADLEDRDVEGAAAEVVHRDRLVLLLVEAVGERGGGGLVDEAHDLEAGDLAGVLGGLPLRVVEVGGHGDDGLLDLLAEVVLGGGLQLLQDHRRDLGGRVDLSVDVDARDVVLAAHDVEREHLDLLRHLVDSGVP